METSVRFCFCSKPTRAYGAGAAVLSRSEESGKGILSSHLYSEGKHARELMMDGPHTGRWVPQILKENDQKINLAGSSDAPVEIPNPLLGIHAAVTRISDHDHQAYFKNECLSRFEAIMLYTRYANYSTMDNNRGYLQKGYIADLSIFEENLEQTPIDNLKKDICYMTVINEHIVYKKSH